MSFKLQLESEKQKALNNQEIINELKEILLNATKRGKSSVFIKLYHEEGLKTKIICHFLQKENIKFEKSYNMKYHQLFEGILVYL